MNTENTINNLFFSEEALDLEKIKHHFYFGKKVFNLLSKLPEKPKVWHYGILLWDIKDCFQNHYLYDNDSDFESLKNLQLLIRNDFLSEEIWKFVEKQKQKSVILEKTNLQWVEKTKIDGCFFYALRSENIVNSLYVAAEDLDKSKAIIRKVFWSLFPSNKARITRGELRFHLEEDNLSECFETKTSKNYAARIEAYSQKGYGRSILFYGPPGSGKSNLVKSIIKTLNYRSITLDLAIMGNGLINQIINLFDPDVLVLEDVNHIQYESLAAVLNNIETFNQRKKIVLATANQVSELDPAFYRPGRFDEMMMISNLDDEVAKKILEEDEDLFQFTKNFPVVFMLELLKRVKVEGKEYALNNSQDLKNRVENLKNHNYELLMDSSDDED